MLSYNKIKSLLENSLQCKILHHYIKVDSKDKVKYIELVTNNNANFLVKINTKYRVETHDIKPSMLSTIQEHESKPERHIENMSYILSENNINGIVKKINLKDWPDGYINIVLQFQKSLTNTDYKTAMTVADFLLVPNSTDSCRVFKKNKIQDSANLLIMVDLETLVKKNNVFEIERIYTDLKKILLKDNQDYLQNLLELLKKCQDLKIVSSSRVSQCPIEQNVKISQAHKAIKLALHCFESKPK